jgi:hypothetical protein
MFALDICYLLRSNLNKLTILVFLIKLIKYS